MNELMIKDNIKIENMIFEIRGKQVILASDVAKLYSVETRRVNEVVNSSPAAKAGLQKGDIITKLEDTKVGTVAKLRYELYKHTPGDKIDVTYNRDGKEYTTQIKLEEAK